MISGNLFTELYHFQISKINFLFIQITWKTQNNVSEYIPNTTITIIITASKTNTNNSTTNNLPPVSFTNSILTQFKKTHIQMQSFQTFTTILLILTTTINSQCDYRPSLHPATEVIFIVPDRTLGHLVSTKAWKGIENLLELSSANADTRMAIVQYGRDGRRGIVQSLTHSIEEARNSFRSSLTMEGDDRHQSTEQLPADQVYIDAAGLVEVMFGTLSNTVASSSKDDAVIRKGAGLGLRTHVPWHIYVLAVANGRRRVTIDSEKEEEITQRFFDIVRPVVTKCVIDIFANDECMNGADKACRHVLGNPKHESSYLGRVGGFNQALTLSNALEDDSEFKSNSKSHNDQDQDDEEQDDEKQSTGYQRELNAVSLQSRLLNAGGHVRVYSFDDLSQTPLLHSMSTLVSPPPWCDRCISFGGSNKKYQRKCPRAENSCVSSHGCVPTEYIGVAWSDLPHRLAWDTLEMTPRSAKEGGRIASLAKSIGARAGKSGEAMTKRAQDAASRRTSNHDSSSQGKGKGSGGKGGGGSSSSSSSGGERPTSETHANTNDNGKQKDRSAGMGLGGLLFSNGIPPRIARMGRKSNRVGHGHVIKRHSTIRIIRAEHSKKSDILDRLLHSKDRVPVVVRGGVWSTWPALVQWRDLGGNFLNKLSHGKSATITNNNNKNNQKGYKIEVKVRERILHNNKEHGYQEAMFYNGNWKSSQMGMANLVDDERSGDFDVLKLNGADPEGIFIFQDILMHAGNRKKNKNTNEKKNQNKNTTEETQEKEINKPNKFKEEQSQLLAADAVFQVPKSTPVLDDIYPPVRSPSSSFVPIHEDTTLWVSTPGTATATRSSSFHTVHIQLRGKRRFTMYSERHETNLMVYPSIHPLHKTSRWNGRRVTAYRIPHKSVASTAAHHTRSEGETERTSSTTLRAQLKARPIPKGIPSWSMVLSPGEMLYVPPYMYYHTEVLSSEEASKVASSDAGNAAAEDAGPKHAEAAAFAAEQAHANEGSSGWHGQEMGGQEDVSITKTQEWMDPLLSNVVENALGIHLAADDVKTVAGRAFALRLHLDMMANRLVSFEGITAGRLDDVLEWRQCFQMAAMF